MTFSLEFSLKVGTLHLCDYLRNKAGHYFTILLFAIDMRRQIVHIEQGKLITQT